MGTSLSGLTPATTFDGLLKVGDNDPLTATLKPISTGDGTDTILSLSNSALKIGGDTEIDSSGLNALIVKRNGTELLKSDGSGLNGALTFTGNLTNKFSLGVNGNDFNIWDGSYLGGGDLRFSILADGKTGIGAQTPTAQLHIKGSGATSATTSLLVQNSAGTQLFRVRDDNEIAIGSAITIQSTRISAYNSLGLNTYTDNGWETNFLVTGNGASSKVGIGETTPTARLHVKGSGNTNTTTSLLVQNSDASASLTYDDSGELFLTGSKAQITLKRDGGGGGVIGNNNGRTYFGNSVALVYSGGKIGINQQTPTAQLQVKGDGATSATTALLVQNSAGTDLLEVRDDGVLKLLNGKAIRYGGIEAFNGNSSSGEIKIAEHSGFTNTIITSKLSVKGTGNTATTTALLVQNSDGTDMLSVKDDLSVVFNSTITSASSTLRFDVGGVGTIRMNSDKVAIGGNTTPTARLHIKGSGATSATTALLVQNSAGTERLKVRDDGNIYMTGFLETTGSSRTSGFSRTGSYGIFGSTLAADSSAVLQADSTTQGFLPPRMTTTQRDAITTPAAGLMVYNTTTNKAQCYNGTIWSDLF